MTVADLLTLNPRGMINISGIERAVITGVSTDSRTLRRGELFVALRGRMFDGHAFVRQAMARGASCVLVDKHANVSRYAGYPLVVVNDTTEALGLLARYHRRSFGIPIIAVAGSNGKTTTKEMIAKVLGTHYSTVSTEGNNNNHIGVPLTLFRISSEHDLAVVEMGTNHFGELRYLCSIAEPTHGLITNIGREHLEFFNDLNGVSKAEGELFEALSHDGIAYVNHDDGRVRRLACRVKRQWTYGYGNDGLDVSGELMGTDRRGRQVVRIRMRDGKSFTVRLAVPGAHGVQNALAAAAVGLSLGVARRNIAAALESFSAVNKRMEIRQAGGVTIIDDTYNANPDSVLAAIETLQRVSCSGSRIAVLADMLELGAAAREEHRRIGRAMKRMGVNRLLCYGPMAKEIYRAATIVRREHMENKKDLIGFVSAVVAPGDVVLVKGSRGMRMEEVVEALVKKLDKTHRKTRMPSSVRRRTGD